MTRVILDFPRPGTTTPGDRLAFGRPHRVLTADDLHHVLPCLRQVEAAVAEGAWAVGFVAYEAAPAFDAALQTRPHDGPAPLLWFGLFDEPVRAAHDASPASAPANSAHLTWTATATRSAYDEAIAAIREGIAAGDYYQVNHTLRLHAAFHGDPVALYDQLASSRHGLYHALIDTDEWAIVSASPELFFERTGRVLVTRPMKGTSRRGRWLDEDRQRAARLAASAKDRAENLMIVDLLRNDLGRLAEWGSVAVPRLFAVETYPTVHQLTSTVTASLREHTSPSDILAAMFPCGSVTGAPKFTAMQAIARHENAPRGPYCGTIGLLRPDGSATFSVAIRTVLVDRGAGTAVYGAGGAITWDSVAAAEYDEITAKASLLRPAPPRFDLLETMRLDDGEFARLDRHLQRLEDSARFLGFAAHAAANAARALRDTRDRLPAGNWRIRLTVDRAGHAQVTDSPLPPLVAATPDFADGANGEDAAARPVALATLPVDDQDELLFHKTTARHVYDRRRAAFPDAFDVLLANQHGEITEFTTGNLVVELHGTLLTPARSCGLLAGTLRAQLLDEGVIRESVIPTQQLSLATRLWHINSVRGWTAVTLEPLPLGSLT